MTTCPSAEDTAAYVLGALRDGEWEPISRHAQSCPHCRAELARLQATADVLPISVASHEPPPHLKSRIMAVVGPEAELLQAAGPAADRVAPSRTRRHRLVLRPMPAAVLASALLAVGLGAGSLLRGDEAGPEPRSIVATADVPGGRAVLQQGTQAARLVVNRLPAPPRGRIYQVWLERGDDGRPPEPTSALFSVDRHGRASVDVPGDLRGVKAVLVTHEPLGGSTVPSRTPIVRATLA